jgi:hypothetical protein
MAFSNDTYVLTAAGPKPIRSIGVGQTLLTVSLNDYVNGKPSLMKYQVEEVFKQEGTFSTMLLNGLKCTIDTLWAAGDGFTSSLDVGSCATVMISNSQLRPLLAHKGIGSVEKSIHHLHVKDALTYLVANNIFGPWYLVHNRESND